MIDKQDRQSHRILCV